MSRAARAGGVVAFAFAFALALGAGCSDSEPRTGTGHGPIAPNIQAPMGVPVPFATEDKLAAFERGKEL